MRGSLKSFDHRQTLLEDLTVVVMERHFFFCSNRGLTLYVKKMSSNTLSCELDEQQYYSTLL